MPHTRSLGRKTPCRHGRKRVANRIEPVHALHQQKQREYQGKGNVDLPENRCGVLDLWPEVFGGRARNLGVKQLFTTGTQVGNDGNEENHDSHASQPLNKTTPKEHATRCRLDLFGAEDTGSRDRLEVRVNEFRRCLGQIERKRAKESDEQPTQPDNSQALPPEHALCLTTLAKHEQNSPNAEGNPHRVSHLQHPLAVEEGETEREELRPPYHKADHTEKFGQNFEIHALVPPITRTGVERPERDPEARKR